jgi:hypothetical protein
MAKVSALVLPEDTVQIGDLIYCRSRQGLKRLKAALRELDYRLDPYGAGHCMWCPDDSRGCQMYGRVYTPMPEVAHMFECGFCQYRVQEPEPIVSGLYTCPYCWNTVYRNIVDGKPVTFRFPGFIKSLDNPRNLPKHLCMIARTWDVPNGILYLEPEHVTAAGKPLAKNHPDLPWRQAYLKATERHWQLVPDGQGGGLLAMRYAARWQHRTQQHIQLGEPINATSHYTIIWRWRGREFLTLHEFLAAKDVPYVPVVTVWHWPARLPPSDELGRYIQASIGPYLRAWGETEYAVMREFVVQFTALDPAQWDDFIARIETLRYDGERMQAIDAFAANPSAS